MIINNPIIFNAFAYIAGICTVLSFLPQMIKIYKTKNVTSLSGNMYVIYNLGLICWFSYGVFLESLPMMIFNFVTFLMAFPILLMITYYNKK